MDETTAAPAGQPRPMVAKPAKQPYINWYQAFRNSYRGPPQTPQEMVRLAAAEWRGMSEEEKRPYFEMAAAVKATNPNPERKKDLKRLESLRPRVVSKAEGTKSSRRRVAPKPWWKGERAATKAKGTTRAKAATRGKGATRAKKVKRSPPKPKRKPKRRAPSPSYSSTSDSVESCCSNLDCDRCYYQS